MPKDRQSSTIRFLPDDVKVVASQNHTVLSVALASKVAISHSCGGMGTCGTCLLKVIHSENLPPRNSLELDIAQARGFSDQERLACQLKVQSDLTVLVVNPEPLDEL